MVEPHCGPKVRRLVVWFLFVLSYHGMVIMGLPFGEIDLITLGNLKYFVFQFLWRSKRIALLIGWQTLGWWRGFVIVSCSYCSVRFWVLLSLTRSFRIPRGPVQQPLEDRIFAPAVSAVYSAVSTYLRAVGWCVFFAHEPLF